MSVSMHAATAPLEATTHPRSMHADLVVIGGGLGGVAAALTAARLGRTVILASPDHWLGGQLTTQGVPPDEHPWVEKFGSRSYRELRDGIRNHYRRYYPLRADVQDDPALNPGAGNVSRLCHEPRVAALVIEELLSPLLAAGTVRVLRPAVPIAVERQGRRIVNVQLQMGPESVTVTGALFADATEEGELLELSGTGHVFGAESKAETGELHAPEVADSRDQQAISWCAALEYANQPGEPVARPASYAHWRDTVDERWPGPQLSWTDVHPDTLDQRWRPLLVPPAADGRRNDMWHYRRLLAADQFEPSFTRDVTGVNWPQIDYWERPLLGVSPSERAEALHAARELTLSLVHWMQTEAPRHDGGFGYPELVLRGDVLGSSDGLAQRPYIREARRIRALQTVTEAHIGEEMRGDRAGSELFADTVGVGYYRIDLHPSTSGRNYVDIGCFPFQIPLGALIPADTDNLIAAAKNIGTTHVTNGAYRLHPVEWSIGEAVGALAAEASDSATPAQVRADQRRLGSLQHRLTLLGVDLAWPEEIRTGAADISTPVRSAAEGTE